MRESLRTSDVARRAGVSVNTIRLYEKWGYLPPVPRAANGYRQFNEQHVQHVLLVRQAMQCTWLGGNIRLTTLDILQIAASGDYVQAQQTNATLITLLQIEIDHAEEALQILEAWVHRPAETIPDQAVQIGAVARRLHVTRDELRSWERDGLLTVPRAMNGYRMYGCAEVDRLLVIRALRRARYSTMAILRLMQNLDAGHTKHLRDILDTPPPDADFEPYPTDSWLSTLNRAYQAAQAMQRIINDLTNPA